LQQKQKEEDDLLVINAHDLKHLVIIPTLDAMEPLWGPGINQKAAVNQLLGTVFQESMIGNVTHLKQIGGPALGIYQIEPATEEDIWENYLKFRTDKASFIRGLMQQHYTEYGTDLVVNLRYATAMARLKYWRRSFKWPKDPNDIPALAIIWDTHYNANPDHGWPSQFMFKFPKDTL